MIVQSHARVDPQSTAAPASYRRALHALSRDGVPFLVGGSAAIATYCGIEKRSKDLDVFVEAYNVNRALNALAIAGFRTETPFPHWLAKAHASEHFIDVIFNSGNGTAPVDPEWFAHASPALVLGIPVLMCPAEETLWSKAFVMERERFDGADVAHLLLAYARQMDWGRLLRRFAEHWPVLFAHLMLFGYAFPSEADRVPGWVMDELRAKVRARPASPSNGVCRGTLLSREQYLWDLAHGWKDARLPPTGCMSKEEIAIWTEAIPAARHDHDYSGPASAQQRNPVE
jgi:hypothetical protein